MYVMMIYWVQSRYIYMGSIIIIVNEDTQLLWLACCVLLISHSERTFESDLTRLREKMDRDEHTRQEVSSLKGHGHNVFRILS